MTEAPQSPSLPSAWTPSSWQSFPAVQQPDWPDRAAYSAVLDDLSALPPLVFAGESRSLSEELAEVQAGRGFLLQAGDCAESFDDLSANTIRDKLKVILQMAVTLTYGAGVPTVKVGRIAGQFAKPRSSPTETLDGTELPSFRGDIVNDDRFDPEARTPDPQRMLQAYNQSVATLNLLRAFTKGGFADLSRIHAWNLEFARESGEGRRYEELATEIERALRFMAACGIDLERTRALHEVSLYTSHEALLLGYEEALTRRDSLTGDWYDCSAHMLWIGERTRQLDGAHVHFLSGVRNPLGVKLGPKTEPEDAVALAKALDARREPGRLTFISRMGADNVKQRLVPLIRAVRDAGQPVIWACDPMHGNTFTHASGRKTRHFDEVMAEVRGFFDACRAEDTWPGGVHLELTGDDVTECLGGSTEIGDDAIDDRYETKCDPRLNARQSLDLAFEVAELLRD